MNRRKWTFAVLVAFFTLAMVWLGYAFLSGEHRSISEEEAVFDLSAEQLFMDWNREGGKRFVDQTIIASGTITEMEKNSVILDNKIQVNFIDMALELSNGDSLAIKGRCVGYDDLLELVKIDQASIVN
ncbi:hypothetical protein [Flagellimonas flava]|uniref:tRNA_anti-like n=1 Tax=Flagellimonas flava TaxID=570519 RepID=A0A1M5K1Y0_9FLAO|nr:hypothetical protein [Allomuricauda flava]SHG46313.1 hypothetical protein SAMN04488116_1321 [Allomuricauda flava]